VGLAVPLAPLLEPGRLLDVGSGNGSPGLVLAALRPDLRVTLLEPRQRRWSFLREAVREIGRRDIEVLRLRHDEYRGARVENVSIRALRLPSAELVGLLVPGGRLLVLGREPAAHPDLEAVGGTALAGVHWRRRRFT